MKGRELRRTLLLVAAAAIPGGALIWNMSADHGQPLNPSGAPMVSVAVPALSATAAAGKAMFETSCAICHGADAAGKDGVAPPLVHKIYESGHHADAAFYLAVRNGVRAHHWPFGDMPAVEGVDDDGIAMIVTYVRELQRANGIF